jgi:hypothetical protein
VLIEEKSWTDKKPGPSSKSSSSRVSAVVDYSLVSAARGDLWEIWHFIAEDNEAAAHVSFAPPSTPSNSSP